MVNPYGHFARAEVAPYVPASAKTLLDVGCNTGAFGEALKTVRQIEVWGVEPNEDAASRAAGVLDVVVRAPFDGDCPVPAAQFDVITFNDVLEHLVDPWDALRIAKSKLRPGGCVVASLPNLLHKENLLHILRDRDFRYETAGIRDRTHLRFFTLLSSQRMFTDCGYRVRVAKGINAAHWSPSLLSRTAYKIFRSKLEETKYIQNIIVAEPVA